MKITEFINEAWLQGLSYKGHFLDSETKYLVMSFETHRPKITVYLPMRNRNGNFIELNIR